MTTSTFTVGQKVKYTNGNPSILEGTIKKIGTTYLTIIDETEPAAVTLWDMGYNIGDCIQAEQIIS